MFRGIAALSGHGAVTVTPRKKEWETCWDRLCWAAFGLGSCRYQGTRASASPPMASQLLSCPWGSWPFFPWLRCFPDTSRPWLLPQVPKGSPAGHGSVCSDHWCLGPAPSHLIQTVHFLMPIALSQGPSSTLAERAQLGASESGATLDFGAVSASNSNWSFSEGGSFYFSLNSQCLGQICSALLEGGQWWVARRGSRSVTTRPPTVQCSGSLLLSNHSA